MTHGRRSSVVIVRTRVLLYRLPYDAGVCLGQAYNCSDGNGDPKAEAAKEREEDEATEASGIVISTPAFHQQKRRKSKFATPSKTNGDALVGGERAGEREDTAQ